MSRTHFKTAFLGEKHTLTSHIICSCDKAYLKIWHESKRTVGDIR